jgi:hypothetical protein
MRKNDVFSSDGAVIVGHYFVADQEVVAYSENPDVEAAGFRTEREAVAWLRSMM